MSEQLRPSNRHEIPSETSHAAHERHERMQQLETEGRAQESQLRASTEHLRQSVEQQAISAAEFSPAETQKDSTQHHHATVSRELRTMTYKRALVRLQKRQNVPDKALSKFIHQGAVDAASETLGKTIARPSGMIGGGLFAFIGTTIFLYTARHYGFRYNFLVFVCLFAGGLFFGLLCEAIILLIRRRNA
jgi:hypothetical protein